MLEEKITNEKVAKLLVRIKCNDLVALGELMELEQKSIQSIAYNILRDRTLAEDIVDEVMITLIQNVHNYQDGSNFSGWLHTITINKAIDFRRKMSHEIPQETEFFTTRTNGVNFEQEIVDRIYVSGILIQMDEMERDILLDKVLGKLTYHELMNKYHLTFKQVRGRFGKAKQHFKKISENGTDICKK